MKVQRRSHQNGHPPRTPDRRDGRERRRQASYREIDAVSAYWNAHPHGAEYAEPPGFEPGTPSFFEAIRPWMSAYRFPWVMTRIEQEASRLGGQHLLDLGCGLGYDSVEFLRRGVRVTATDISGPAVELARRHFAIAGVRAEAVKVANALALPFADGSFDTVWSNGVLYYTGDMPRALREIRRVLRPGGRAIVLNLRRRPSWMEALSRFGRVPIEAKDAEPPVSEAHTEAELREMFRGFEVIETTRDQYRAGPIARRGWKAALYRWGFRPAYNAIPRVLAQHWASKLSVIAVTLGGLGQGSAFYQIPTGAGKARPR